MSRALVLAYGVVAYLAFLAVMAGLVVFVARGIDGGEEGPVVGSVALDLGLVALFGVTHSVMARPWFKDGLARLLPAAAERSTYVLVADATLGLLVWQWRPMPAPIWNVEAPALRVVIWSASGAGAVLAVYATFLTDHFDLFGLRQVWLHARGRAYAPVPFTERGAYRYVRQPMMLGMLIWFWSTPTLSVGHLVFAGGMSAYIFVGVALEERALARRLGDAYAQYQARVGRFLPRL